MPNPIAEELAELPAEVSLAMRIDDWLLPCPVTFPDADGVSRGEPDPLRAPASDRAAEVRLAFEALGTEEDVRQDRVAELRRRIEDGTFDPQPRAIADRLLRRGRSA